MESDPLRSILHQWEAPEPTLGMDARVLAAYRSAQRRSLWRRIWTARVTIPAPVLAALLIVVLGALAIQIRSSWLAPRQPVGSGPELVLVPRGGGYVTRLDATGFQPLPNGTARIVRAGTIRQ
jgi:hypothetical protein